MSATWAQIGDHRFVLEVATTPAERELGLMDRDSLPKDRAMLFTFPKEDYWTFWMKNTRIALDIIWFTESGTIVDIQTMQPEPDRADENFSLFTPRLPAKYAIEMNAGLAQTYSFSLGMHVKLGLNGHN